MTLVFTDHAVDLMFIGKKEDSRVQYSFIDH